MKYNKYNKYNIKCDEARELLSPWIDQETRADEQEALKLHLASCAACRQELAEMKKLSSLLRASLAANSEEQRAPAEMAGDIMHALRREAEPKRMSAWKKRIAGMAATLALFLGSTALITTPVWQLADRTPGGSKEPVQQSVKQTDADKSGKTKVVEKNIPGTPGTIPSKEEANSSGNFAEPGTKGENTPNISPEADKLKIADIDSPDISNAPVFLSKDRALITTLLKLRVAEPALAQQQALRQAENVGASIQVLGQQMDDDKECMVIKISLPSEKAASLKNSLATLGSEISRQEDRQDLSTRFADTLEQYRVLSSRAAAAKNEEQARELEAQLKSLETQLINWDKEAAQESIVLWLEY